MRKMGWEERLWALDEMAMAFHVGRGVATNFQGNGDGWLRTVRRAVGIPVAESGSVQSMTVTIQALRAMAPTRQWYMRAFRREAGTALLLGVACGTVVGLIVWLWRGNALAALSIGTSLLLALCTACWFGLSIPAALHALKLDPKIAAGPVTLACTDVFTLFFYLAVAAWLL